MSNLRIFSNSDKDKLEEEVKLFLKDNKNWEIIESKTNTFNAGPKRKLIRIHSHTVRRKRRQ